MDRDVGHLDLILFLAGTLHAVVKHDVAERTRGRDSRRTRRDCLGGALIVDLGADVLLHPHAGASSATAHALGSVARHLDDLDTIDGTDDVSWRHVHVVVPTEVARVVVGDALLERCVADVEFA